MSSMVDEQLATTIRAEREARGWSIAQLAERSGVSKAMISKVERREASPTAALLGRLSGALGLTMSELLTRAETGSDAPRLTRAADQPAWRDPDSGYERRAVSPPGAPVEIIDVTLPPGATVSYPADAYTFIEQQLWVLGGTLAFTEGDTTHTLRAGDCLRLGAPAPCTFHNAQTAQRRGSGPCRYAVVITRR
jgi:transcriptional regulator with XRE-family HTH domain